jgi:hypothetical protein
MNEQQSYDLDHLYIGFNRENFIRDIFEPKYNANVAQCAMEIGIKPNYLRDILYSGRNAGAKTLSSIYRYCVRAELDPTRYIFVFKEESEASV